MHAPTPPRHSARWQAANPFGRRLALYQSLSALAAENLFLRKQLALYRERGIKPRRATHATRIALMVLARWFDGRQALVIVQPATLIRWHRQGFRLFRRWTSRHGRPPIPTDLQALIRRMAHDNPTWGEERIANELCLKLGLRVSPRTVCKYIVVLKNPAASIVGHILVWCIVGDAMSLRPHT
jgi:putative transposase